MNFFGDPGRNRPPPPTIKKVMMKVPSKDAPKPRPRPFTATSTSSTVSSTPRKSLPSVSRSAEPKERVKRLVKRKSHTPTPVISSEDESGTETSASSFSHSKRVRLDDGPVDSNRNILDVRNRSRRDGGKFEFRHGADLVTGESGKKYLDAFEDEKLAGVELQYPSDSCRERYVLAHSFHNTEGARAYPVLGSFLSITKSRLRKTQTPITSHSTTSERRSSSSVNTTFPKQSRNNVCMQIQASNGASSRRADMVLPRTTEPSSTNLIL